MYRAPSSWWAAGLAVLVLLAVATGLLREYRAVRMARRELDSYLQWLLWEAAGPVRVAVPHPWR